MLLSAVSLVSLWLTQSLYRGRGAMHAFHTECLLSKVPGLKVCTTADVQKACAERP